ncbi:unnamed protein product [Moneuplotes crassus]|uniref:Uncharacterized protein n=1 Tax=Euplotes crassus TaxID=5936 RepID=A0AAD1XNE5_EUPCR|nr:unnamed protein product [Moneuplotes crassus]
MFELIWNINLLLAWLIGLYTFVHSVCMLAKCLIRNYLRQPLDLAKRYGKGSWAIVTGSTGGIGAEYCKQLAKQGFNLVLFGRNKDKLEELDAKLKKDNSQLQTQIVVADFAEDNSAKFYEHLYRKIQKLDISILINNAGAVIPEFFENCKLESAISCSNINMAGPAMLTRMFINDFLKRTSRTAIINVSSLIRVVPSPYIKEYSATKQFLTLFSYYLQDNYGDKIDIQDLNPAVVTTNLSNHQTGPDTITPEHCVTSSLRDLGQEFCTVPAMIHSFIGQMLFVMNKFMKPLYRATFVNDYEMKILRAFYEQHRNKK